MTRKRRIVGHVGWSPQSYPVKVMVHLAKVTQLGNSGPQVQNQSDSKAQLCLFHCIFINPEVISRVAQAGRSQARRVFFPF
jgi:hypothetical protein